MARRVTVTADHLWPVPGRRAMIEAKAGSTFLASEAHAAALLGDGAAVEVKHDKDKGPASAGKKARIAREDQWPDTSEDPRGTRPER